MDAFEADSSPSKMTPAVVTPTTTTTTSTKPPDHHHHLPHSSFDSNNNENEKNHSSYPISDEYDIQQDNCNDDLRRRLLSPSTAAAAVATNTADATAVDNTTTSSSSSLTTLTSTYQRRNYTNSTTNDSNYHPTTTIRQEEKFSKTSSSSVSSVLLSTVTPIKWFHLHKRYFQKMTKKKNPNHCIMKHSSLLDGSQPQQQQPLPLLQQQEEEYQQWYQQYQQQQQYQKNLTRRMTITIGSVCILYIYVLYRTQYILEIHEQYVSNSHYNLLSLRHRQRDDISETTTTTTTTIKNKKKEKQQTRPLSPVKMIPISPIEMMKHPDAIHQMVKQIIQPSNKEGKLDHKHPPKQQQQQLPIVSSSHRIGIHSNTSPHHHHHHPREPRTYFQSIQRQALQTKNENHWSITTQKSTNSKKDTTETDDLFLVYNADIPGQGIGNLMAGLLAAHLLGDEFHRIVCVNPQYDNSNFAIAFTSIDPIVQQKCNILFQKYQHSKKMVVTGHEDISLINFAGAADECAIQNILSDIHHKVVYIVANTYPRWPTVPDYYFLYYYQPTTTLLNALPYTIQPTTVVHLRQPDDTYDTRNGLDTDSLFALGQLLPNNASTFLVTNNVDYYNQFEHCCHWSHPKWDIIQHSALEIIWGSGGGGGNSGGGDQVTEEEILDEQTDEQHLHMWIDWYTILMADDVYHTHSDFSISAIHFMNKKNHAYSIRGYNPNTKQLETQEESWWIDGETIPLVHRTIDGQPGTTNALRACSSEQIQKLKHRQHKNDHHPHHDTRPLFDDGKRFG